MRRRTIVFDEAARRFRDEATGSLKAADRYLVSLQHASPWIGDLALDSVHDGTIRPFIEHRLASGAKPQTVNRDLVAIRRVLTLAAGKWRHPDGTPWLRHMPLLEPLPVTRKRTPYPLTWEEQQALFALLPTHLQRMCVFAVNTGLRDAELRLLRWEWEINVPEMGESVFVIPGEYTKNGDERLLILNETARAVLEECRGTHPEYVFTYAGRPVVRLLNSAFKRARVKVGLPHLRVHDLRHTFATRLRAAGVSLEDRKTLLGHRTGDVTMDYSADDLLRLRAAVRSIEGAARPTPVLAQNWRRRRSALLLSA